MTEASVAFPDGLVGLPDLVEFGLAPVADSPLFELVSRDDPSFGFVAARADDVSPGMSATLTERGLADPADDVLVLLTVRDDPPVVTANLAGPLVLTADGVGRQLVLEDPAYPLRAPVPTA